MNPITDLLGERSLLSTQSIYNGNKWLDNDTVMS